MDILNEIDKLNDALKQQRDEIKVQLHLASLEAKEEWDKAEKNFDQFIDKVGIISDETKETGEDILHTTKVIGDELKTTYQRIKQRLTD
jgi:intergrase/recombinase